MPMLAFQSPSVTSALEVRRAIYSHEPLNPGDMDLVFAGIREAGKSPDPEWTSLFCEAVTDYVVHQNEPPDYISDEKAQWLIGKLGQMGGISSKAEFAMVIGVMNHALGVPAKLSAFALKEIGAAIVKGRRCAFNDETQPAGVVTKPDADALRAVLYAATPGSAGHVTREEAQALFEIANATANAPADPAFDDVFARAVGNYLMGATLRPLDAAETLHREHWLSEREALPGFFSRLLGNRTDARFPDMLKSPLRAAESGMAKRNADDARARQASEVLTEEEIDWVAEQLTRDRTISSAETKLLQWLAAEAHALPPKLKALVEKVKIPASKAAHFGRRASGT
jgi:hypothetical protein